MRACSGAKTAFSGDDDDDEDLGDSRVMKCVRGVFPFTPIYEQNGAFFICKVHRRLCRRAAGFKMISHVHSVFFLSLSARTHVPQRVT